MRSGARRKGKMREIRLKQKWLKSAVMRNFDKNTAKNNYDFLKNQGIFLDKDFIFDRSLFWKNLNEKGLCIK